MSNFYNGKATEGICTCRFTLKIEICLGIYFPFCMPCGSKHVCPYDCIKTTKNVFKAVLFVETMESSTSEFVFSVASVQLDLWLTGGYVRAGHLRDSSFGHVSSVVG